MPSISDEVTISAGVAEGNLIANSKFVQVPYRSTVLVYCCQDGADAGAVRVDFTSGQSTEIDDAACRTTAAGVGPELDKHRIGRFAAAALDRLQFKVTNRDPLNDSEFRYFIEFLPF